jgi:hypothetical protein
MKLYENIVIGNFLYGLGYAVRANQTSDVTVSAINLLQQTPADKILGDMLLAFPGVVRLLEFKTQDNRSRKELERHQKIALGVEQHRELLATSRKMHWYIETRPDPVKGVVARIVPYLDAFPRLPEKVDSLDAFITRIAREVTAGNALQDADDERTYLRWIKITAGEGEVGTGGLVMIADENGTLRYAPLNDLIELQLSHRDWVALHQARLERRPTLQHEPEHQRQRDLGRDHDIDHGSRSGPSR